MNLVGSSGTVSLFALLNTPTLSRNLPELLQADHRYPNPVQEKRSTMPGPTETVAILDSLLCDASAVDESSRTGIVQAARRLLARAQSPTDRVMDLCWDFPAVYASVKVLHDLGIWTAWRKTGGGERSLDQIRDMARTNVESRLLGRLLRCVASHHILGEAGSNHYIPTSFSLDLGHDESYTHHLIPWASGHILPACFNLPSFLEKSEYREPAGVQNSSYADAFPEKLNMFDRCGSDTLHRTTFNRVMGTWSRMKMPWTQVYDTKLFMDGADLSRPLVVDIGGNMGDDLTNLLRMYPDLPAGVLTLQDRPEVVAKVAVHNKIKVMACDFLQSQPIESARIYYLGQIIHDWPDTMSAQILNRVKAAMVKGYSKLLISDIVVPDTDTIPSETSFDIQMMALLNGVKRTENEWRNLLHRSGFEVVKIWKHPMRLEAVLEAELLQ